jgi:hypothetical protein
MAAFSPTSSVDLSELLLDLDLQPPERAAADLILPAYERALTERVRDTIAASREMIEAFFTAFEQAGLVGAEVDQQEVMQKMQEVMQSIMADMLARQREIGNDLRRLNEQTLRRLEDALPADVHRRLERRYTARAFPMAVFAMGPDPDLFDRATRRADLTDEQRGAIAEQAMMFRDRRRRLVDETVETLDAQAEIFSPFDFDAERIQEFQTRLQNLREDATSLGAEEERALAAILGEEEATALAQAARESQENETTRGVFMSGGGTVATEIVISESVVENEEGEDGQDWVADPFLPGPIGSRDIARWMDRLGVAEDQRPVVEQLHTDYRATFETVRAEEIQAVVDAVSDQWEIDEDGIGVASSGAPRRIRDRRRAAQVAIIEVDGRLFDDLATVLTDAQREALPRVRLERMRSIYRRQTPGMLGFMPGARPSEVDLTTLVEESSLPEEGRRGLDTALLEWEERATEILERRYEVALDAQMASDLWMAEMTQRRQEEGFSFDMTAYQETVGANASRMSEVERELAELTDASLDRLLEDLDDRSAIDLRRSYDRRAHPSVFTDPGSLEGRLDRAAEMTDLSAEQRRSLEDLSLEYRTTYRRHCDEMIETRRRMGYVGSLGNYDEEAWERFAERQQAIATIAFDRDELNARSARRLEAILPPEQLERIGGLPKPPDRDANRLFW